MTFTITGYTQNTSEHQSKEKDGSITEVSVAKSVHEDLDSEAIRLVKNMPPWMPGTQRGKAVKTSYVLPINFKLQ